MTLLLRSFDPVLFLGNQLIALWDAERSALVYRDGSGLVSMWRDVVAGRPLTQPTGAAQPVYSATSFNGAPGVTFDGVDDTLETTAISFFPSGADPCEIWIVCDQAAIGADANGRFPLAYGGASNNSTRSLQCSSNANLRSLIGTGGSFFSAQPAYLYERRHFTRLSVGPGSTYVEHDGLGIAGSASTFGVPATALSRFRLGANSATTSLNFFKGSLALVLFTNNLLNVDQAAALSRYCQYRRRA